MLRIKNLTKVYDDGTVALKDVSFEVPDGQFVAVIGLSGSGKSTLLRCINRLIEPTSGEIWWNDVRLSHVTGEELRRARRRIGMIFQHFNLVDRSSVLRNVLSGRLGYVNPMASVLGRFPAEDMTRAYASLDRVGIRDKADNRADELSGGQRQRVGIARALMQEPELILADEPVASLDPALAHSIMRHLQQINQEDGITVLCSLHFPGSGPTIRHPGHRPQRRPTGLRRHAGADRRRHVYRHLWAGSGTDWIGEGRGEIKMEDQDREAGYWFTPISMGVWFVVNQFIHEPTNVIFIMAALIVLVAIYLWYRRKISTSLFKMWLISAGFMVIFNILVLVSPLLPWQTITVLVVLSAVIGWIALHSVAGKRFMGR